MCCVAKKMDDPLATHTHTHPTPVDCLWLPPPVDVVDVSLGLPNPILLVVWQHERVLLFISLLLTSSPVPVTSTMVSCSHMVRRAPSGPDPFVISPYSDLFGY